MNKNGINSSNKMTAINMIDSCEGFWVNGTFGVTDTFSKSLIEQNEKVNQLLAKAGPITSESIMSVFEEGDKSKFLSLSAEELLSRLSSANPKARIA